MIPAPLFGEILPPHLCAGADTLLVLRENAIVSPAPDAQPVLINSACALEHLRCIKVLWDEAQCLDGSVENRVLCAVVHSAESNEIGKRLEALKFASSLSAEFWGVCGLLLAPGQFDADTQFLFNRPYSYSQAVLQFCGGQLPVVTRLFETCTLKELRTAAIELAHPEQWTISHTNWIDRWLTPALTCRQHSFDDLWSCIPRQMHGHLDSVQFLLRNNQHAVFTTLHVTPRIADCAVQFLCEQTQCWDRSYLPCLKTLLQSPFMTGAHILQLILHIQYPEAHAMFQLNRSYRHLFWAQSPMIVQCLFDRPDAETELLRSSMPYVVRSVHFKLFDLTQMNENAQFMFLYNDEEMLYNACWLFKIVNAQSQILLVRMAIRQNKSVLLQHFMPSLPATFPLMHNVFDLAANVQNLLSLSTLFNYSTDLSPLSTIKDQLGSGTLCRSAEHDECCIILAHLILFREFQSTLLFFHNAERFHGAAWSSLKCCTVCQTLHVAAIRGERSAILWFLEDPPKRITMIRQRARISLSELYVQQKNGY